MKFAFIKSVSLLTSLVALGAVLNGLPANAETVTSNLSSVSTDSTQTIASDKTQKSLPVLAQTETTTPANTPSSQQPIPTVLESLTVDSTTDTIENAPGTSSSGAAPGSTTLGTTETAPEQSGATATEQPVPGTTSQSATGLTESAPSSTTENTAPSSSNGSLGSLAQDVDPGRPTRSGSSYVGIGGNIGLGDGDTQLGDGSFAILSKIGLTSAISVRPSLLISDGVTILLPVTYDFSFGAGPTEDLGFTAAPFIGLGPVISTEDDVDVNLLLTGGVDIPISSQFTATASVNASVTGDVAVGILLGIGYNFAGF